MGGRGRKDDALPGFGFLPDRETTIQWVPKTAKHFKERVRAVTLRSRPVSMEQRNRELNRYPIMAAAHGRCSET